MCNSVLLTFSESKQNELEREKSFREATPPFYFWSICIVVSIHSAEGKISTSSEPSWVFTIGTSLEFASRILFILFYDTVTQPLLNKWANYVLSLSSVLDFSALAVGYSVLLWPVLVSSRLLAYWDDWQPLAEAVPSPHLIMQWEVGRAEQDAPDRVYYQSQMEHGHQSGSGHRTADRTRDRLSCIPRVYLEDRTRDLHITSSAQVRSGCQPWADMKPLQ